MRPTMYLASMDIKTAFDEARPRHVSKITENHDTDGWLIAVLLREMSVADRFVRREAIPPHVMAQQVCGLPRSDGDGQG